ncbi:MAG: extracellular solute-binding protein [Planctomycetes bacterium]|nr:extracellular solute-binding protein [Planctomycetota bacterium]
MGYRKSMNVVPVASVRARRLANLCAAILLAALPGCRRSPDQGSAAADKVTVYCSVDESFARGILDAFKAASGVDVAVVFDSEAGKTTGLVNRISHEAVAGRTRADVFWSSELFNTILLARRGLLESYDSPAAADIPVRYRDTQHRWTALAVRGRVIAFNANANETIALPTTWEELAKPEFARTTAFPNPLFGTTRGHLAAMFALWGPKRGRSFLTRIRENGVLIVDGNSAAVRSLLTGRRKIAATDTDDVWVAQARQAFDAGVASIDLRYLDMGDGGTLLIPCSVAIVKGAPHPQAARRLVDYLVSAEVERLLAQSGSRNVPVREHLRAELGMAWPPETKVDFNAVADAMDEAVAAAREILLR